MEITHKRLLQLLHYDRELGWFMRLTNDGGIKAPAGSIAGGLTSDGYLRIMLDGVSYKAHRIAWFWVTGEWPSGVIDHRDGDGLNNAWNNLRDVTQRVNIENQTRANKRSIARLLGVSKNRDRWSAKITTNGQRHHLGTFETPVLAHAAYIAAKRELHKGCTL